MRGLYFTIQAHKLIVMQEFGKEKHMVHSGMLASAEWLRDRLYCVALVPFLACISELSCCCPFLSVWQALPTAARGF